jgi:hypothetical protein
VQPHIVNGGKKVTSGMSQGPGRPTANPGFVTSSRRGPDLSQQAHPILWGLLAMVIVAAVVGGFLALGALAASRVLGVGGSDSGAGATAGASMYLPEPEATAVPESSDAPSSDEPSGPSSSAPAKPANPIRLAAAPRSVGSFERINLTGTYPGGNGAILQVQRKEDGRWVEFSVTAGVNGESFATYVQTSRVGENRFRMLDTDSKKVSNAVTVTVG